jgi:predicted naringenin-chalcone synthase
MRKHQRRAVAIQGLGTAVPPGKLSQTEAAELAQARCAGSAAERAWIRRVYRASGVVERGSVLLQSDHDRAALEAFFPLPEGAEDRGPTTAKRLERYASEAGTLGSRAASAALANGGVESARISHIVTVSCTGLMSPDLGEILIRRLNLPPDVGRVNLGFMGCHGAFNGLRAAAAFARADPQARVLLCCTELCSLHFQYGRNRQQLVANALFADGAGAVILGDASPDRFRLMATASRVLPDSAAEMTWTIGDHGFEMGLSPRVPVLIREKLREWLQNWLAAEGVSLNDIAHWAIHPGGPKIIEAVGQALALRDESTEASRAVLAEHGNMSSPTVLFVIEKLRARGARGLCVALAFGPGLVFEAALLELP